MRIRETNILNMWHAVKLTLAEHEAIINLHPEIAGVTNKFYELHAELYKYAQVQANATTGITLDKLDARLSAVKKGYVVAANLRSYAKAKGDLELMNNMDFSMRDFQRMPDAVLLQVLQNIIDKGQTSAAGILGYGTTPDKMLQFETLVKEYKAIVGKPRTAINKRTVATARIGEILKEGQVQLGDIDKLIHNFEDDYPDFLKRYFNARIIVDRGG